MATQEQIQLQQALNELIKDHRDLMREINNELKGGINYTKEVRKQYNLLESISDKLLDDEQDYFELTAKQLEKERARATKSLERLRFTALDLQKNEQLIRSKRTLSIQEEALLEAAKNNFSIENEILDNINKKIDATKNLNRSLGLTGSILKSAEKITNKIGLSGIDDVFRDARKSAQQKAKDLGVSEKHALGLVGQFRVLGAGLSVVGKGIGKALLDPLVLITAQIALVTKLFNLYKGFNQLVVDQARTLAISADQSREIARRGADFAATQKDSYITQTNILQGRALLNNALQTSIDFSDKEAITAKKLVDYYGLSNEESAKLTSFSKQIGSTNEQTLNTILKTAVTQKAQLGGTIKYQEVAKRVSNISGDILTRFKGNVVALTAAVQQADRLGLTLEQVDKIGESLLNFESSIENELKAELLTGKAINLERARSAALSGDTSKLMSEIAAQVGNIHKFEKMNTIQRKAYAEAFGMTANEMGDMLRKQQFEAQFGKISQENAQKILETAKARGVEIDDQIKSELEQKSLAQLQQETFQKLKDTLVRITEGPMSKFVSLIEKVLNKVQSIFNFFGKMSGGPMGDALGTVLLSLPLAMAAFRGLTGIAKSIFLNGLTPATAPWMRIANMGGGMMGGPGMMMGGGGLTATQQRAMQLRAANPNLPMTTAMSQARYGTRFTPGTYSLGMGLGLGIAGMGLNAAASGMEPGGARTAVGALGGAATGAGMGMMFGPWGAAIGGLVGGVYGLVTEMQADREAQKAKEEATREANRKTQEMLEDLAIRPVNVYLGPEKVNTGLDQYGTAGKFD